MRTLLRMFVFALLGFATIVEAQSAPPETIIELNLGADPADDIQFTVGQLSTIDDGAPATTGFQNTAVQFVGFLDALASDIASATASFTMTNLVPAGDSTTFSGFLVAQDFLQGSLSLYAPDNSLLLSADLTVSSLTGPLGPPGEDGFFLAMGNVTGGQLAPYLDPSSLVVRMNLPTINTGGGFSVTPPPGFPPPAQHLASLNDFAATATVEIQAQLVPEPSSVAWLWMGAVLAGVAVRRRGAKLV